jgi:hypothetical protein
MCPILSDVNDFFGERKAGEAIDSIYLKRDKCKAERPKNIISTGNSCHANGGGRELKRHRRTRECKTKEKGKKY